LRSRGADRVAEYSPRNARLDFCFRYWPTRLQRSHDKRTVSRGYSWSCRDPPAQPCGTKEKGCRMIHNGSPKCGPPAGFGGGGCQWAARLKG
jgi:hypothetical protein